MATVACKAASSRSTSRVADLELCSHGAVVTEQTTVSSPTATRHDLSHDTHRHPGREPCAPPPAASGFPIASTSPATSQAPAPDANRAARLQPRELPDRHPTSRVRPIHRRSSCAPRIRTMRSAAPRASRMRMAPGRCRQRLTRFAYDAAGFRPSSESQVDRRRAGFRRRLTCGRTVSASRRAGPARRD